MNVFEQVKEAVDMRTVAEGYGLNIDRSGMCLCPFHAEKTPSAKVYSHNIYCFGCGASADVIGFTQKMFSLPEPIEAVKKLNADYGLHISVGKAPTTAEVSEYHKRIARRKAYEEYTKWNGLPMQNGTPYFWLGEFCEKHDLPFYGLHSFRHLFASLLVNQGVDIVTVSGALGHSTVSTTSNIYCHMLDEARAKVSEAVSSALDFSGSKKEPRGA